MRRKEENADMDSSSSFCDSTGGVISINPSWSIAFIKTNIAAYKKVSLLPNLSNNNPPINGP